MGTHKTSPAFKMLIPEVCFILSLTDHCSSFPPAQEFFEEGALIIQGLYRAVMKEGMKA
jgi:hypothetical protein